VSQRLATITIFGLPSFGARPGVPGYLTDFRRRGS
jgi:hypothetical protein